MCAAITSTVCAACVHFQVITIHLAVTVNVTLPLLTSREGVVKGGSRSRFTENKTVFSQFTKNKDIMKITFISHFTENNFAKSRFTATMEITIHEEKISHFTFHGKRKGPITSRENTLYHPLGMFHRKDICASATEIPY